MQICCTTDLRETPPSGGEEREMSNVSSSGRSAAQNSEPHLNVKVFFFCRTLDNESKIDCNIFKCKVEHCILLLFIFLPQQ